MINKYHFTRKVNYQLLSWYKKHKKAQLWAYPNSLMIETTNHCNAQCPLCPTGAGTLNRDKGMMSLEDYQKIINEVRWFSQIILLWNYGEPFMNPRVFEMIKYAKQNHLYVMSSTNGFVFYQSKNIDALLESGLDKLLVSFDGFTPKVFGQYRKGVVLSKVKKGLRLLSKKMKQSNSKMEVDLQFLLMKHNIHEYQQVKNFAKELGFNFLPKKTNVNMVLGQKHEDWLPKKEKLTHYQKDNQGKYQFQRGVIRNEICEIWESMVINWDGTVNPCCHDYQGKIKVGSSRDTSIIKLWNSPVLNKMRKKVIKGRDKIDICKTCPIIHDNTEHFQLPFGITLPSSAIN